MAVMRILAGPPGTGKTWTAAREAVRVLIPSVGEAQIAAEHQRLVREGRIIWVTFHPSFSYEDFVEGFRPEETETGGISYSIIPGAFLKACRTASAAVSANRFHIGQKIGDYEVRHVEAGGLALYGQNDRKDAVTPYSVGFVDFWTLKLLQDKGLGVDALRIPGKQNERKQEVARLTDLPTTFFANSSRHAAVYEHLLSNAITPTGTSVVLVIDEINRADLSRVFGELITLLEFDKRQGAAEEREVLLTYSQKPLTVPAELSIIGTMNTADRSLSSIDLALRRRFEFITTPPRASLTPEAYGGINVQSYFASLNRRLGYIGGADNLIGHADFMQAKLNDLRNREGFSDDQDGRLKALAQTLRTKTIPLLLDLFRSDWNRVRAVVGAGFFEQAEAPSDLPEEFRDILEADATGLWQSGEWWDPNTAWNADRFRGALEGHLAAVPATTET
jgi:5-methylcytosine-specific restriction enzyme B